MKTNSTILRWLTVLVIGLFLALPSVKAQAPYCTPAYSTGCSVGDGLVLFQLNTINQPINCLGSPYTWYHDYTAISTEVEPGQTYNLTVQAGYSNTYLTVWVDWNNDLLFSISEILVNGFNCSAAYTNYVIPIQIPTGIDPGNYRLRFRTNWLSATTDPCASLSYGNAADFTLTVPSQGGPGSVSATYTMGDIPTDYSATGPSSCPATMTIAIPSGSNVLITGVDVSYTMTAASGAWMSEQRSRIAILNPGGVPEATYAAGSGTTGGTFTYNRTGLQIGANVSGGGNIVVQMDAFRTWGGTGCNTTYNKVDNGTWTVTIHYNIAVSGSVAGIVKDAATNTPIIGAHVMVGNQEMITLADGAYTFDLMAGDHTITVHKAGYATLNQLVTIAAGETLIQDLMLTESANPPGAVLAELNASATAVNITWGLPQGLYEIIYDDGVAENVTAWGLGGNMNALRFTPAGYPAKIMAGSVNIYDGTYPPNGNALVPFQMAVYDASGPLGYPGNELGVVDVTPGDHGWVSFDLSALNITITSGDFYLVMIQGGNFPNCAPIAVDQSNPVMRSYSRFVTGGAPWTPAGFNDFMMRAIVQGPGGPQFLNYNTGELVESSRISEGALFLHAPQRAVAEVGMGIFKPIEGTGEIDRNVVGYRVYRLVEGQEGNEAVWTMLGNPTNTAIVDNSWPSLADGAYRWAVKARYPMDNFSVPVFSNVLRKNWASNVTINVTLSDPNVSPAGIQVGLTNTQFPQYAYNGTTNAQGVVNFPQVWKGNYNLVVYKFGYELYQANMDIMTNTFTKNVLLLETTYPPTALYVDPVNIHATWVAPGISLDLLQENWSSGSFATNEWTFAPAQGNWQMASGFGNPAPSAQFYWSPSVTNYSNALVSKQLSGLGMPNIKLKYDIYLSNYSTATLEQFAVEVFNGTNWITVANYTNAGGSIPWTTYTHDITQHAQGQQFRVRFRAYGANSFNINNWNLDNIMVYGEVADGGNRGVLGYFVYLDDVMAGFTEETHFQYQPEYINYGQTYTAGVRAVYESGFSPKATYVFTSMFLYPPCNLQGEDTGHAVTLTWEAPGTCDPFGGGGGGGGGGGTVQLEEGFEGTAFPPAGWVKMNPDGGTGWESINVGTSPLPGWTGGTATAAPNGGSKMAWCTYTTGGATSNDQWLVTPQVTVETGMVLKFYMRCAYASSYNDNVQVKLSTTVNNSPAAFNVNVATIPFTSSSSEEWILYTYTLSDFVPGGTSVYIGFREYVSDNWNEGAAIFIDNVYVGPPTAILANEPGIQPSAMAMGGRDTNLVRAEKPVAQPSGEILSSMPFPFNGGEPYGESQRNEVILNYDGPNFDAIGLTAGGTFHVAARFPAAMVGQYAGYTLQSVDVYINNVPTNATMKIWGAGTATSPGAVLHQQVYTPTGTSWNTITLTTPVTLDGNDLWIGYSVTHGASQFPAGCDAGPANPNGDWISLDGVAWEHLAGYGLNYNWNIRGKIYPGGGGGGGPIETAGFRIYRDNVMIAEVDGETFDFVDSPLIAGTYSYKVTALYNYLDGIVESQPEGPISVTVAPGLGFIQGVVYNCNNFQPIGGATITAGEFSTVTQPNGTFTLVAHEGVYNVNITAPGHFPVIVENVTVVWQQTTTMNVCMIPYQISVNPTVVNQTLLVGGTATKTVTITNNGAESLTWAAAITFFDDQAQQANGNVEFTAPVPNTSMGNPNSEYSPTSYTLTGDSHRALFDLLMNFPVGDVGGTYSVATDGIYIYSARWNALLFHKYTMTGSLIESFSIPGAGNCRDLTYDGEFFYAAPNSTTIYKMNFTTQTLAGTITAPVAVRGIAYDAVNDGFWITNGWDGPLRLISRTGSTLQTLTTAAASMSGLAWENVSPGGPFLWAYTQPASNNILVKISMTNGSILQSYDVANSGVITPGSISGGLTITNKLIQGKWVFLGCAQNDVIWALELADAATWLTVSPTSGTLAAGASATVSFNFNAAGLSVNDYLTASVMFSTNPNVGSIPVAVSLFIDSGVGINDPVETAISLYPVPATDVLNVNMPAGIKHVRMFNFTGQLVMDKTLAGEQHLKVDVKPYQSGAYIMQFITNDGGVVNKKVLINR